jgi:Arc/MetJ-type ribon-helix-helix transcriptional regulator
MTKNHPHPSGITSRPAMAAPLSVSLTITQVGWIDQRRALGSLSRSAIVRQALDRFIEFESAQASQPQQSGS